MSTLSPHMKDLLQRTANALAAEQAVPLSPGDMDGARPRLCAAAAIVYQAAAMAEPEADLAELAHDMVSGGNTQILGKAKELHLDPLFVADVLARNDSCRDDQRRGKMVEYLSDLAR